MHDATILPSAGSIFLEPKPIAPERESAMVLAVPQIAEDGGDRYFVRHDGNGWAVAVKDDDGRVYDALPGVRTPGKSQAEALAAGLFSAYTDGLWDGCQQSYKELRRENDELHQRLGRRY